MRPDSTTLGSLRVQSGGGGYSCFATSFCTPDEKMYVRIAHPEEKIYLNPGGYPALTFVPLVAGDYEIGLTSSTLDLSDAPVIDTTLLPLAPVEGRL